MPNGIARLNKQALVLDENKTGTTATSQFHLPTDTRYIIISSNSKIPLLLLNENDVEIATLFVKGSGTGAGIYEEYNISDIKLKIKAISSNADYNVKVVRFFTGV